MTDGELLRMAFMPMAEWDKIAETFLDKKLPGFDHVPVPSGRPPLDEVVKRTAAMAVQLCRFSSYMEMRYGSGCGDQGHKSGVKEQNKVARSVRSALGFTYPKAPINF